MKNIIYKRNFYQRQITPWIDKSVIKVLTGMRRVGKSCLLRQVMDEREAAGIPKGNLIWIDKESVDFDFIETYKHLIEHLEGLRISSPFVEGMKYLFIDEVQEITGWERAVTSLLKDGDWDIYLTGSNAHMLSSELATLLSGRYVEIAVYPLSLPEFLRFNGLEKDRVREILPLYLRHGGFPALHQFQGNETTVYQYINSLYDTIVLKDIVSRHELRNVPLFQQISRFVFDNIGNPFSAKRVADYLKSQRLKVTVDTVQNYLGYLTETFALYQVRRYDIKGRRHLEIYDKYYLGDIGLRNAQLGYRNDAISGLLENLVFLELRRRGHRVDIGKIGDAEVDFVASSENGVHYWQVCYLLASEETLDREFGALARIPDNHPKTVLSLDPVSPGNRNGISWISIIDFLMGNG